MLPNTLKTLKLSHSFWGKWFLLALLIGLAAGLAAILFQFLVLQIQHWTLDDLAGFLPKTAESTSQLDSQASTKIWLVVPVLALGGLLSGSIIYLLAPEAEGSGADGAIDAFHNQRGIISWRVPVVKTIASAITLGTGGSAGREGPVAHICAGIGSLIGKQLKLSTHDRRLMLAIGMGAEMLRSILNKLARELSLQLTSEISLSIC